MQETPVSGPMSAPPAATAAVTAVDAPAAAGASTTPQPATPSTALPLPASLVAALLLTVGLAFDLLGIYSHWPTWDPPVAVRAVPLLMVCAAQLACRTRPLAGLALGAAAAATDMALGPSPAVVIIWTDVLYAATVHGPRRLARCLLTAAIGIVAASSLTLFALWPTVRTLVVSSVYVSLVTIWPVVTGFSVRGHRERAEAERERAAQTARLAELDHAAAVHAERARMARELHDVVANHLSAVAVQSAAALAVRGMGEERMRDVLAVVRENSVQGLSEMRRMIGLLRDGAPLDDERRPGAAASGAPAMPRLSDAWQLVDRARRSGLAAELSVSGRPRALPTPVDLAAYRILQETLTNALKHATPPAVQIELVYLHDRVVITASNTVDPDRGRGLVPGTRLPGAGAGLVGMAERASLLGGTFTAGPCDDAWRVRAELPSTD